LNKDDQDEKLEDQLDENDYEKELSENQE